MLPTTILLVDDHALMRAGLALLLRSSISEAQIVEAASLDEAMHSTTQVPSIVLLDIQLQGLNGLDGIALLQRKWPQAPIVMLSSDSSPKTVQQALERGAIAFVSKGDTADNILTLVGQVLSGRVIKFPRPGEADTNENRFEQTHLTPRQSEVLNLLCQGLANKVIARRLNLSENTVRAHVQAVLAFLQVTSRSEAIFVAHRRGLIG